MRRKKLCPEGWTEEQPFRIMRSYVNESYFVLYDVRFVQGGNFNDQITATEYIYAWCAGHCRERRAPLKFVQSYSRHEN